jgi:hypothetical protein
MTSSGRTLLYYLSLLALTTRSDTFQYAFMCQSQQLAYNFTWRLRSNTNDLRQSTALTATLSTSVQNCLILHRLFQNCDSSLMFQVLCKRSWYSPCKGLQYKMSTRKTLWNCNSWDRKFYSVQYITEKISNSPCHCRWQFELITVTESDNSLVPNIQTKYR